MKRSVVVFGREPIPGRVKTRLSRSLGPELAARVYALILEHTLQAVADSAAPGILSLAEAPSKGWSKAQSVSVEIQSSGDLGDRMADAFDRRFRKGAERVVLVGSDCPGVTPVLIDAAFDGLRSSEVVLGPANDGGYWLVAQRVPGVDLFSEIPWSRSETLGCTRERLTSLGASWTEIDQLQDIDTASDLVSALDDPRTPLALRRRIREIL